ncbi:MAG: ATP-binding protein [Phycisphaerae bacterium]|nr:ATP-binding protein [Phycisphaerae bacterium]
MDKCTLIPNPPNAAKLINSLRHLDYTNESAILDLIDNSIDAHASQIWVEILSDVGKKPNIVKIIDNGIGMNRDTLDEALKLGSEAPVPKNSECDLGLYGMGLVTASISLGRRLEVITRNSDNDCFTSVQDLDTVAEQGAFVKLLEESNANVSKVFEDTIVGFQKKFPQEYRGKISQPVLTGTMITISKIDNCKYDTIHGFEKNLRLSIGQAHRKFIQADTNKIYINGEIIKPLDPILDYEPTILNEGEIKLDHGSIYIKIAELKDYGDVINKQKKIGPATQGFYIVRNNREIMAGQTLDIYTRHPSCNLLRIEFNYPGSLDKMLSSNFSKSRITLPQDVKDKVSRFCSPFIAQAKTNAKNRARIRKETKEDFSEVERYITRKSHLLKTPKAEIEKREQPHKPSKEKPKTITEHGPRLNITKRKRIDIDSVKVRFEEKEGDEKGPLYEADQERDIVVVRWNIQHPFYADVIVANSNNPNVFNPLAFLIYSFATAELSSGVDTDSREIIDNIRYEVGRNLAVLMH